MDTLTPTPIKSNNALILNRLHEMQQLSYYVTAKEELALAESTILRLERELAAAEAKLASVERELSLMRELEANPHYISKVKDLFGPLSLWSQQGLLAYKKRVEAETIERCAKVSDGLYKRGQIGTDIGSAIRALQPTEPAAIERMKQ